MEKREVLLDALSHREFLYRYAWRLLAAPLDEVALSAVAEGLADEPVAIIAGEGGRLVGLQRQLCEEAHRLLEVASEPLVLLDAEYTRLFVGPGKLPAPPWESVYRADGDLLFQESTLHVREAYREAGFKAAGYPREADDHVATELSFMATLAKGAAAALEVADVDRASAFMTAQKKFLDAHLSFWLPRFAERLTVQVPASIGSFYPLAACFAAELCVCDMAAVEDVIAVLR